MKHTLESHSFFPYIAWVLVLSFAVFTFTLTQQLSAETEVQSERVQTTMKALHQEKFD